MNFLLFFYLYIFGTVSFASREIIPIVGVIDENTVEFVLDQIQNASSSPIFYFDTPGGSVPSGVKLIPYLENTNSVCVAQSAYSMGFVLFQACSHRYMLPYGSLMQHDMYLGIRDNFHQIRSYIEFLGKFYDKLIQLQIDKIGIPKDIFLMKILENWWMTAEDAVLENCADAIISTIEDVPQ